MLASRPPDFQARIEEVNTLVSTLRIATEAISIEPASIRVAFAEGDWSSLVDLSDALAPGLSPPWQTKTGLYGVNPMLEVTVVDKVKALEGIARSLHLSPDSFVRVGDQGTLGGNDETLLAHPAGFTVGDASGPVHCYRAGDRTTGPLKGIDGTTWLREHLTFAPTLSIVPSSDLEPSLRLALRSAEALATREAQRLGRIANSRWQGRMYYLLGTTSGTPSFDHEALDLSLVYDATSGAVRLSDAELDQTLAFPATDAALGLDILRHNLSVGEERRTLSATWSLLSDDAILLRGPNYYPSIGKAARTAVPQASWHFRVKTFIQRASLAARELQDARPSLVSYKLALGIADNLRNLLLACLTASIARLSAAPDLKEETESNASAQQGVVAASDELLGLTKTYLDLLFDHDASWTRCIAGLVDKCRGVSDVCMRTQDNIARHPPGWRECDNFVQNYMAVQLALHRFRESPVLREGAPVLAIGLANGGVEMPVIASALAPAQGLTLQPAYLRLSMYGNAPTTPVTSLSVAEMRTAGAAIVRCQESAPGDSVALLFDDNLTTARTLQQAIDFLAANRLDVVGIGVVRYPGANRHMHNALPDHGYPDPTVLFSLIRGLVAPSPYSRLIFPNNALNPYLDGSGVFDLSKEAVERLVALNLGNQGKG